MNTQQKQLDFIAIGDITTDAFIQLDAGALVSKDTKDNERLCVNFGDKIEYEAVEIIHGVGNSANAAVSAARLGIATALDTFIGGDLRGKTALDIYKQEGIDTQYIKTDPTYPTHYHFVLRHGAERTILVKHQPWNYQKPTYETPPKWIYFSSIGEHGEYFHHDLAQYCIENNVKLAFQPGTFQIKLSAEGKINDMFAASEIFFCNKQEAQRILKTTEDDIQKLLIMMRNLGPKNVIITDGPNGAFAQNSEGSWSIPMYPDPAPVVDRTGAGDAFSSTVTAMLALGMSLPDAIMRGPINSMNVCQYVGAQKGLLSKDAIEQYLANAPKEYTIEQIKNYENKK